MNASFMAMFETPSCMKMSAVATKDCVHTYNSVPAGLAPPCYALIHHVVCDQEVCLKLQNCISMSIHCAHSTTLTSSTHQPSRAACRYSVSDNCEPFNISTVSTTDNPLLSLPENRSTRY